MMKFYALAGESDTIYWFNPMDRQESINKPDKIEKFKDKNKWLSQDFFTWSKVHITDRMMNLFIENCDRFIAPWVLEQCKGSVVWCEYYNHGKLKRDLYFNKPEDALMFKLRFG